MIHSSSRQGSPLPSEVHVQSYDFCTTSWRIELCGKKKFSVLTYTYNQKSVATRMGHDTYLILLRCSSLMPRIICSSSMQQLRAEAGKMNLRPQLPMSHSLYILSKTPVAKTDIFESPYRVHLLCVIRVQKYHFSEQSPNSWFHHPSESSMATLQVHGASRTLLSFPIPENHRVDLPRNKCPAGDNTHGAPRVAPKNCPPKNKPTIPR